MLCIIVFSVRHWIMKISRRKMLKLITLNRTCSTKIPNWNGPKISLHCYVQCMHVFMNAIQFWYYNFSKGNSVSIYNFSRSSLKYMRTASTSYYIHKSNLSLRMNRWVCVSWISPHHIGASSSLPYLYTFGIQQHFHAAWQWYMQNPYIGVRTVLYAYISFIHMNKCSIICLYFVHAYVGAQHYMLKLPSYICMFRALCAYAPHIHMYVYNPFGIDGLISTHWDQDEMDVNWQTTFSNPSFKQQLFCLY